ncbi:MAG TPA: hypothetical protein VNM92_13700 [Thermoanaerobaculia bacterium]|nr:hypothetical protein [Thermoanaerobaculia bacterium]
MRVKAATAWTSGRLAAPPPPPLSRCVRAITFPTRLGSIRNATHFENLHGMRDGVGSGSGQELLEKTPDLSSDAWLARVSDQQ